MTNETELMGVERIDLKLKQFRRIKEIAHGRIMCEHADGRNSWPVDFFIEVLEGARAAHELKAALDKSVQVNALLKEENERLEKLCDDTYVASGADAYNHACEIMEKWQDSRRSKGVDTGTVGSLCDGLEWLYERLDELEKNGDYRKLFVDADNDRIKWSEKNEELKVENEELKHKLNLRGTGLNQLHEEYLRVNRENKKMLETFVLTYDHEQVLIENERLKAQIKVANENNSKRVIDLAAMHKENEELKSENERLRDALDRIAKIAGMSRTETKRLNWIVARAKTALAGDDWDNSYSPIPNETEFKKRLQWKQEIESLREQLRNLQESYGEVFNDGYTLKVESDGYREQLKGPDGFPTWKEAAISERLRRVDVEQQLRTAKELLQSAQTVLEGKEQSNPDAHHLLECIRALGDTEPQKAD